MKFFGKGQRSQQDSAGPKSFKSSIMQLIDVSNHTAEDEPTSFGKAALSSRVEIGSIWRQREAD